MENIISTDNYKFHIKGSTIRVEGGANESALTSQANKKFRVGVVSLLPRIQIAVGQRIDTFLKALELSRTPLALQKIINNGQLDTYRVLRLQTGNIPEATIATVDTYMGIILGVTYNTEVLSNKEFRKLVKLSAMHQIVLCPAGEPSRLLLATKCIGVLTNVDRDKLIVKETKRNLMVRVNFKSKLEIPVYYIFSLGKDNKYRLSQIGYNYNNAITKIKEVESR